MNDNVFQSIRQGLTEVKKFAQGQTSGAIVHEFAPLDIKAVRAEVDVTQTEFATADRASAVDTQGVSLAR